METAHYVVSYGNLFGGHSWGRGRTGLTDAGALSPPESPSAQHEAISIISLVVFWFTWSKSASVSFLIY